MYREQVYRNYIAATPFSSSAIHPDLHYKIREYLPQSLDAVIVDLGCGLGGQLLALSNLHYTNLRGVDVGCDYGDSQIDNIKFVKQDILTYLNQCSSNSIDCCLLHDVLEHFTKNEIFVPAHGV